MIGKQDYFGDALRYFSTNADLLTKLWTDVATRTMAAWFSGKAHVATPMGAREMRSDIFKAVADSADAFMRTPLFLEAIKRSLNTSVQYRRHLNEMLSRVQYEFQSASRQDVDNLMQMVNHLENRMADDYERILEKMDGGEKPLPQSPSTGDADAAQEHIAVRKQKKSKPITVAVAKKAASRGSASKKVPGATKPHAPVVEPAQKTTRRTKKSSRRRIYRVTPLPI